ncbi:uncharacterized protein LOC134812572 [Bolinopsis microptera]|uniref:uncharacterized protein LOC134812572 n=1 Tax=Bolinopsis microptera TaxID=2820187 RepID=UPI00307A16A8
MPAVCEHEDGTSFEEGIEFKDTRLAAGTPEFAAALKRSPGGCLPSLVLDGNRVVCQSLAITRYVASLTDYKGRTAEDTLYVNMFIETLYDLIARYDEVVKEKDQNIKVIRSADIL